MTKLIIFDFDGLIIDTEVPEYQSWREVYEDYGVELSLSTWIPIIGLGSESFDPCAHLQSLVNTPINPVEVKSARTPRHKALIDAQPLLPGVEDYIADAKFLGMKLGVASSSSRKWVVGHLIRLGLAQHFDVIKCKDDVGSAKPDPASYLAVLNDLEISHEDAIALEDSVHGVQAARSAGIFCLAVPNPLTKGSDFSHASLKTESLAELNLRELLAAKELHAAQLG
jgi:HAD superfamily hydrolase (TIGR01509 family)